MKEALEASKSKEEAHQKTVVDETKKSMDGYRDMILGLYNIIIRGFIS